MNLTQDYINKTLNLTAAYTSLTKTELGKLPLYITEQYHFLKVPLFKIELVLAHLKDSDQLSILQTEKQVRLIEQILQLPVVVVIDQVAAFNRKRLIAKRINFIVPDKQLFLPQLLIDLRETKSYPKSKNEKLLPSAQFLLLYHILYTKEKWQMERHSFKEIASKFNYTPMAITNAIENLKTRDLVQVTGEKEKFIHFPMNPIELWQKATNENIFINPVLRTVYSDNKPTKIKLPFSNGSALSEYTNLNPGNQTFFAIHKTAFYKLQKNKALQNLNDYEGKYALEVWKYDPGLLAEKMQESRLIVDPLSLYLSMVNRKDERLEMALKKMLKEYSIHC
jgi:hypothetical protein